MCPHYFGFLSCSFSALYSGTLTLEFISFCGLAAAVGVVVVLKQKIDLATDRISKTSLVGRL